MISDPLSILKALADESRLRLVNVLAHGSFNVQELTAILNLSQPTISHHLKVLQQSAVVSAKKQGTWAYYSLPYLDTQYTNSVAATITSSLLSTLSSNGNSQLSPYVDDHSQIQFVLDKRRDASKHFFEEVAPKWNQLRQEEILDPNPLNELVSSIPDNLDIVDLGCGSGALLELILPRSGTTIAVDYSQSMLQEATRTLGNKSTKVDFRLGYLEHLPLADESVDIAVAHMVLHHLAEPKKALKDIRRILRPKGRCFIVDLTSHDREYMRERYADLWLGFNSDEIVRWAKEAGFSQFDFKFYGASKESFLLTLI
jgi:ubiquinone/menaquinone biosynthesis C-methylase UbiE